MNRLSIYACCSFLLSPFISAAPVNGNVTQGTAQIDVNGQTVEVSQSTTSATITWDSFDVGLNEAVEFSVPNSNSITLNQIGGLTQSQILGSVSSNGILVLQNANGVYFGPNSSLNSASFIATTGNASLSNSGVLSLGNAGVGSLENAGGSVSSVDGFIAMIGSDINNSGQLAAADAFFYSSVNTIGNLDTTLDLSNDAAANTNIDLISSQLSSNTAYSAGSSVENSGTLNIQDVVVASESLTLNFGGGVGRLEGVANLTTTVETIETDGNFNSTDNELEVGAIRINGATQWQDSGDVLYLSANTDIVGASLENSNSLSFIESGTAGLDISLGTIGFGNSNSQDPAGLSLGLTDIDSLELKGDVFTFGGDFLMSQGSTLTLARPVALTTQGGAVEIDALTTTDANWGMNIDTTSDDMGNGSVYLGSVIEGSTPDGMSGPRFLDVLTGTLTLGDQITVSEDFLVEADSIELLNNIEISVGNIGQFIGDLTSANGSDLTINAGQSFTLSDIGNNSNAIGQITLAGTDANDLAIFTLTGDVTATSIQTENVSEIEIDNDAIFSLDSIDLIANSSNTELTGSGNLVINAAVADLAEVSLQGLEVNATTLNLDGQIQTSGDAGIDLSGVTNLNFADSNQPHLSATNNGQLDISTISQFNGNASGNLLLQIDEGDLTLGSMNGIDSISVTDLNSNTGSIILTQDISVNETIDFSDVGTITTNGLTDLDLTLTSSSANQIDLSGSDFNSAGLTLTLNAGGGVVELGNVNLTDVDPVNPNLSDLDSGRLNVETSTNTTMDGDLYAETVDLLSATEITLNGNSAIYSPSLLVYDASLDPENPTSVAFSGSNTITFNAVGSDLHLAGLGSGTAGGLVGFTIVDADDVSFNGVINVTGNEGINVDANSLFLQEEAVLVFDTSQGNSDIDLSELAINGSGTLVLNAGNGSVALGNIGQSVPLAGLDIQNASVIKLVGSINTSNENFDFSFAQAIELVGDVLIDTSASEGEGNIDFGNASIDGTFDLTLISANGLITFGEVGQDIALQDFTIITDSALSIDENVTTVGDVNITTDTFSLVSNLQTTGGEVLINTANGIDLGSTSSVEGFNNVNLAAEAGDIVISNLVSNGGDIAVNAGGSIYNGIGDFTSFDNTSINLTAESVSLTAGSNIGQNFDNPVVLLVPSDGVASFTFGANEAYIVNLNDALVVNQSSGVVLDALTEGRVETEQSIALSELSPNSINSTVQLISEMELAGPLYAISQAGHIIPVNVEIEGGVISSLTPDVPGLYRDKNGWKLRHSIANTDDN